MAPSISILYVTALFLSAATSALSIPVATTTSTQICIPIGVLADGKTPNVICAEDSASLCNNSAWDSDIKDAIALWCGQQNEELRRRSGNIPNTKPLPPSQGPVINRGVEKRGVRLASRPTIPEEPKEPESSGPVVNRGVEKRGVRLASPPKIPEEPKEPESSGPVVNRGVKKRGLRLASPKIPQEPKEPESPGPVVNRGVEVEKRGGSIPSTKPPRPAGPKVNRGVEVEERGLRLASPKVPQEPKEPEASEPSSS